MSSASPHVSAFQPFCFGVFEEATYTCAALIAAVTDELQLSCLISYVGHFWLTTELRPNLRAAAFPPPGLRLDHRMGPLGRLLHVSFRSYGRSHVVMCGGPVTARRHRLLWQTQHRVGPTTLACLCPAVLHSCLWFDFDSCLVFFALTKSLHMTLVLIEEEWVGPFCADMLSLTRIFCVVSSPEFGLAYDELWWSLEWSSAHDAPSAHDGHRQKHRFVLLAKPTVEWACRRPSHVRGNSILRSAEASDTEVRRMRTGTARRRTPAGDDHHTVMIHANVHRTVRLCSSESRHVC